MTNSNTNNQEEENNSQGKTLSLRDIYLDLPPNLSKILVEAGITSLLNCIETQKKLILSAHYITSKISNNVFNKELPENTKNPDFIKLMNQLCDIYSHEYLKSELIHAENNSKLFIRVVNSLESFETENTDIENEINDILKFMKKEVKGSKNRGISQSAKLGCDTLSPSDDMDNFQEYYKLRDVDIIDEAEDIATHLMNEVSEKF